MNKINLKIDASGKEIKKMVDTALDHKRLPLWIKALIYTLWKKYKV